ncbi:S8 family serine peptidase [Tissierella sp. MSJ-40]|uniref:S8 family serine peptidase n=1 Tax=Tissierella simiarum TaxID=2841534 RepID=A0ABS6E7K1_9FIRM|nr:S8 family serine peptidase [Tissierella simiarum]MBU5438531.1 S8 family serine peptidase [Tissierella simiarum]
MLKRHMCLMTLITILIFSFLTPIYGDSAKGIVIDGINVQQGADKDLSIFEISSDEIIELPPFKPRLLSPIQDIEKHERWKGNKLTWEIRQMKESGKFAKDDVIKVQISPYFEFTDEEFLMKIKENFGEDMEYEKVGPRYNLDITIEQLDILEAMDEVMRIADPDEEQNVTISHETNSDIGLNLDAATEMMGIKKARSDFGVTGDLDGNKTKYSKNDVVIAIVDTGIDAGHIDLDGGKVIGWYDVVNGESKPYDDHGHGTHVASIAAGTGEGDPNNQVGFAPGAALVGVKVMDKYGGGYTTHIIDGLQWIYDNIDKYNIDVVNMSIGTHSSYKNVKEVIDLINDIDRKGVPVFVAAGNEGDGRELGRYYDTLSTYAKYTSTSVGSVRDPYEGGWGLSKFSSRGTGNQGPYIVAPGHNIRAARANSRKGYKTDSGTSMSTPAVTGTYALMLDAAYTRGNSEISFSGFDMGPTGYDKLYGNGNLLGYESIKRAGRYSGSFDNYRTYIRKPEGYVNKGDAVIFPIEVNSSTVDLNVNLLILDENNEDLDIVIWEPGANPLEGDPWTYLIGEEKEMPHEHISIKNPKRGTYYIGVAGMRDSGNYSLEITGYNIEIGEW